MRTLILIFIFTFNLCAQWFEVVLPQTYPVFNKIKFINDDVAIIVGDSGTILRTTDGGLNWNKLLNITSKNLKSINIAQNNFYVCGDSGFIIESSNFGVSWNSIPFQFQTNLSGVFFIDTLNGYVVGENSIYKTTNKGGNWTHQTFDNNLFQAVYFINKDTGFATSLRIFSPGNFHSAIYKTTNGGIDWFIQISTPGEELYEIYFIDSVGYIIGEHEKVFRTTNYGSNWYEPHPTTPPRTESFFSTFFIDSLTGWITGDVEKIYKTSNGALSWDIQLSRLDLNKVVFLNSIVFKDSNKGFAVGSQRISSTEFAGIIFKTTNGGITSINDDQSSNRDFRYKLHQNYPNPFNPVTTISYQIKEQGLVQLKVYNLLGQEIVSLVNEVKSPGIYESLFDASNLPSGVYIYSLRVNDFVQNNKMTLLK